MPYVDWEILPVIRPYYDLAHDGSNIWIDASQDNKTDHMVWTIIIS